MKIEIQDFHFDAVLGILEEERKAPQKVIVNCVFDYDYEEDSFVDYAKVADYLKTTLQKKKFFLIEEALEYLIPNIKENFSAINYLKLKISKPQILENCLVSAQLEKNY